jgi:general secretion pathway protein G
MKTAFSLLELIFAIVILGIVASFAIPKFVDTKDSATASTLKRDVDTAINSIQSYYMLNQTISEISDAITINSTNWILNPNTKITDKNACLTLEILTSSNAKTIQLNVDTTKNSSICTKLRATGLATKTYELN